MTKCISCYKPQSIDSIDEDGYCFDCANFDPEYNPNSEAMMRELVESTMDSLAKAKGVSALKIKSDFVAEHVYNHPEKYAQEIITQSGKKKSSAGSN